MQPCIDYSLTVSKLYETSFDALSAAGPVDITQNMKLTLAAARWKIANTEFN